MGTWGPLAFDNDDAMDWCYQFEEAPEGVGSEETPGRESLILGLLVMAAEEVDGGEADGTDARAGQGDVGGADDEGGDRPGPLASLPWDLDEDEEPAGGMLGAELAAVVIAAAEVVAAIHGRPGPALTESEDDSPEQMLLNWASKLPMSDQLLRDPEVKNLALRALQRVRESSELMELWSQTEPGDNEAWLASLDDLASRLSAA